MMSSLMQHIRETARDDIRLYLAPFVGALASVRKELNRTRGRKLEKVIQKVNKAAIVKKNEKR
jgi:hypothetical protein